MAESEPADNTRREFLSQATLAAVGAVLAACSGGGASDVFAPTQQNPEPTPGTSGSSLTVTLASFPALGAVGGIAAVGNLGAKPVAVVRDGEATYVALSRICTHAGCDIGIVSGGFQCPCHGSRFNSSGVPTQGPAQAALQRFNVVLSTNGTTLTIS
ncbi:MAG: Rieske 2Fe-2S domain-containing protein [Gemmatimonadetes bacterium]|nr:Rieske 2Fe-2S domain-containing protein [Gemmatimonadota bacterium]